MHYNVLIIHIQSALKHETELIIMHQKMIVTSMRILIHYIFAKVLILDLLSHFKMLCNVLLMLL